mgnify:CR=1 FL=1
MTDILDEILNDDKDAKRLQIFRKTLPIIIIFTIITAIIIAGYTWFSQAKTQNNQEIGDSFVQLVSVEYTDEKLVTSLLEEITINSETKLSELASIKLVSTQVQLNDIPKAIQALETIIDNKEYSEITTSYARILYISLILDIADLSTDQENKSREYLQYFNKDSQVFYATATLLKSLFYLKINQFDFAKEHALEVLKLPRASGVIKEQAKAVLAHISIKT